METTTGVAVATAEQDVQVLEMDEQRGEIALLAYTYWQDRGCEDGHDVEDWLAAEQEVRRRQTLQEDLSNRREARTAA